MRKSSIVLVFTAIFSMSSVFADETIGMTSDSDSKPCATIAAACLSAGFVRSESSDKKFWKDCMKPIVLGHSVTGVSVDAETVKACRTSKIQQLKQELKQLESVS
jgi:hypothetical protein